MSREENKAFVLQSNVDPSAYPALFATVGLLAGIPIFVLVVLPILLGLPRYDLRAGALTVRTLSKSPVFSAAASKTARVTAFSGVRVGGIGAPGQCSGRFRDDRLGELLVYSDCSTRGVVFEAFGQRYAITPANPEAFVRDWRAGHTTTYRTP